MASGLRGILASLSIKLSADSAELDRDLEKGKKSVRSWADETASAAGNVGKAMGAAAVAAGAALAAMANKALENMDQQAEFAQRVGASVEQLTRLQYAAKLNGAEQETLNKGLQTLVKNSSEAAQGLGKSVGAFNELGLSAEKLNMLAPDQQFMLLADAMKDVENQNDRTRIAIKLFGDEGAGLVNVLSQGQAGLKAFGDQSDAAGYTVVKSQAEMAQAAGDASDAMQLAFDGAANRIATFLGPTITDVKKSIAEGIPIALDMAQAGFFGLRLVVSDVFDTITAIVGSVAGVITSAILTPIEKITQGLAYALSVLGSDGAADVQAMADNLTAARETADDYALSFTRIGDAWAENKKTYDASIDAMVAEKAARQAQLDATKSATLAVKDFAGANQTKAESDQAAARAAKEAADADKERVKQLQSLKAEGQSLWDGLKTPAEQFAAQMERINFLEEEGAINAVRAANIRDRLMQQQLEQAQSTQNARSALGGISALDAAGEDPMAQAQSEWVGKQAALQWMLEQEQITRDQYNLLNEEATKAHQQNLVDIEAEAAARRAQFENMSAMQKTQFGLQQLQLLTNGIANHNRKAFEVNKAASIGLAIINTAEGATKALAQGGFFGIAMAAAVIASGIAQINTIRAQRYGGGTTPSLAGSTPTYNGVPVTSGNSQNTGEDGGAGMKVTIETTVIGSDPAAVATELNRQLENPGTVRKIITSVREVSKAEQLTVLDPSSRNALDIRAA